ncbi:DMT family transporter [Altererythrobacter sp. Root672]|uniref:DMT family transporter n=1 Tax=Altererythrobacter sp. Root672 TaxID=1736584 RepID=UPI0006F416C3|nr:DMT family transporter [Altererythrobacter sp. Root672]KRA81279.1 permease [Altererythrobacter sp. Root672]
MPVDRNQARAFALLGLVMVFWAGNSIVARAVRADVAPFTLAFIRWTGACLAVAPFAIGPLKRDWPEIVKGWKPLLLLGLVGVAAFNGFLYSGLQYTTATNALLLQAATPAIVVLLDRTLFGVRHGTWQVIGVSASMLGVLVIVFEGDASAALQLQFGKGDALILCSVVVWSLYTVFLRLRPPISPVSFIAVTFSIAMVTMAGPAVLEWQAGRTIVWSPGVVGAFLYVALLPSLLSYFIYNYATGVVGPAKAGQAITLMPLFGAFLSAGLLGERLHPFHFVGMVFILAGIALSLLSGTRKEPAGAAPGPSLEDRA